MTRCIPVVHPDGSRVYISASDDDAVQVLDTATDTIVNTISVGNDPWGVAVSPDGSRVYVANRLGDSVSVIDTTTDTVVATVSVGNDPRIPAVTPDGSRVYVTNRADDNLSVIDTATNTQITTLPIGDSPVAFGPFIGQVLRDDTPAVITLESPPNGLVTDQASQTLIG